MLIRSLSRKTRKYGDLGSTNEEMNRFTELEDPDEGFVITSDYQSAGKGHQGNSWSSEKGKNLLFSVLLKPDFLSPEKAFHLSRIVSLAVLDVLDNHNINAKIKWPNDIMAGSSKICGILIENSISGTQILHSIVGIGLNVNQEQFDPDIPAPGSLCLIKGCHFDRETLLEEFRNALEKRYQSLYAGNENSIRDAYHKRLYLQGEPARYSDGSKEFWASILSVLPGGELEVKTESGDIRRFGFKEIEYLGL
jgi:BirA family biotin operon repressor/biotin-[acetyl-CoA-carboxylase] ligase